MMLNLGQIYDYKSKTLINHRSIYKVLFNPIFRTFGWELGSLYTEDGFYSEYQFERCSKRFFDFKSSLQYDMDDKYRIPINIF